ncbi:MAG TPA: ABC transporter permease, partial [Anaerolineaceae bacterium]|nr:ABC transporter permease [Anaerolineaceae bacterium]
LSATQGVLRITLAATDNRQRQATATVTLFPGPSWRAFYPFSNDGADASNGFHGTLEGGATVQPDPFLGGVLSLLGHGQYFSLPADVASVLTIEVLSGKLWRILAFGGAGLLIGGISGLLAAPLVGLVCGILGLLIGLIMAFPLGGRFFSNVVMRVMDIILSFPSYLLAIAIVAFLGPGLEKGMIAIGVVGIPIYARLTRSAVLSVVQKEYVLAAQSVGESHNRILFRHIVPNTLSPIIVQATMGLASAILSAAALGFLGLGAIPPEPEWGAMLGDSYRYLASGAWWAVLFPGLAIMLSVLGFNLLGDGLRDALDPKMRT